MFENGEISVSGFTYFPENGFQLLALESVH